MNLTPLKRARRAANLSQRAVSVALDVTHQTVANWEAGKNPPPGDMLILLARMYGRRPEDLIRVPMRRRRMDRRVAPPLPLRPADDRKDHAA